MAPGLQCPRADVDAYASRTLVYVSALPGTRKQVVCMRVYVAIGQR